MKTQVYTLYKMSSTTIIPITREYLRALPMQYKSVSIKRVMEELSQRIVVAAKSGETSGVYVLEEVIEHVRGIASNYEFYTPTAEEVVTLLQTRFVDSTITVDSGSITVDWS